MNTQKWTEERAKLASALLRMRNTPQHGFTKKEWTHALLQIAKNYPHR